MARKIEWLEPDSDLITKVDIHKSATLYGTYSQVAEINATSDGNAKSSSNTWVTEYTDVTGIRTEWYKVRFYDGTNLVYSDFSDPVTSEELVRLCSVDDVKETINTVGRWTDDEIFEMITQVDDMIYIECGTPLQGVYSQIGKIDSTYQDTYYVGERDIYRVDRVFYGTTTKTELFLDDGYRVNKQYGMVKILPVGSSGITLNTTEPTIEIEYVPKIYHRLSLFRTCQRLLEKLDFTSGGTVSKELSAIERRLDMVETILQNKVCMQLSSDVKYYDSIYGVNRKKVVQDHHRNNYVGSYGWI